MIGKSSATTRSERPGLVSGQTRYFAVDCGPGSQLIAALSRSSPWLRQTFSPRHADLLIVFGPISHKLAPSVAEVARALPRPSRALVVEAGWQSEQDEAYLGRADIEALLPGARIINLYEDASLLGPGEELLVDTLLKALRSSVWPQYSVSQEMLPQPETIRLPGKGEREVATELAVLSLGPIQPFTAGPLRTLLVCDGGQVLSASCEAGYAHRGIAQAMQQGDMQEAARLAQRLDPLAPFAGRLACVRAMEELQGRQPSEATVKAREAALGIERARNHLWWLARFADNLEVDLLAEKVHKLASELDRISARLWPGLEGDRQVEWVAPQLETTTPEENGSLDSLSDSVSKMPESIGRDRLLALRTKGVGFLEARYLMAQGVSGPVLAAGGEDRGDTLDRLQTRLSLAAADLRQAAGYLRSPSPPQQSSADWKVPAGEANVVVQGPRGEIALRLISDGGDKPARVEWSRPSAALLKIVPAALEGQKLADAEVILGSLDLSMAEADG